MKVGELIRRLIWPNTYSSDAYIRYLKKKGVKIGQNTRFIAPKETYMDVNRGEYISIGSNCCLSYATIIAHDYSWYILGEAYGDILPDPGGKVVIGNNCFIGYQACILKDTIIGDNVIIGARSVVKGIIPSNTVWAGVPAKQICTLDEYYKRKKSDRVNDALKRYHIIQENSPENEENIVRRMGLFAPLFLERTRDNYEMYISAIEFNGVKDSSFVKKWFYDGKPIFDGVADFAKEADR